MIPEAQQALVLNVEERDEGRQARSRILREAGFEVIEAATGADALRLAIERKPHLLLLDVQLPDIDGLEVCRRLRLNDAGLAIAVIHISSTFIAPDLGAQSSASGADIFLAEPVEAQELVTVVRTVARLVYARIHSDRHGRVNRLLDSAPDITEDKRLELARAQLHYETAAREKAEKAAKLQNEFLAMLSHELRTPMSAALGWLQLLRRGTLGPDKQAEALDIIERNVKLQDELITDLLDVSGILAGKLKINPAQVDLVEVVDNSVESAGAAAQKKGVALKFDPAPLPRIHADAARLQQVFGNLLSNSIKFTPAGGVIDVRIERRGGFVSVSVSDNGEGIDPALLPHLFERFLQGDRSRTRVHGGLGLGLAMVKHLVEAHAGKVFADSKGPGQGSTFTVMLPVHLALEDEPGNPAVNRQG